jgi:hypothetical protein
VWDRTIPLLSPAACTTAVPPPPTHTHPHSVHTHTHTCTLLSHTRALRAPLFRGGGVGAARGDGPPPPRAHQIFIVSALGPGRWEGELRRTESVARATIDMKFSLPRSGGIVTPHKCVQNMKNSDTQGRGEAGLDARRPARKRRSPTPVWCGTGREGPLLESERKMWDVARRRVGDA